MDSTTKNKRPHDDSNDIEDLYDASTPRKKGRAAATAGVPVPISLASILLSGTNTKPKLPTSHPSCFKPISSLLQIETHTPAVAQAEAISTQVAQSGVYRDTMKPYTENYEKRTAVENKNESLEVEKGLGEKIEGLQASLRVRNSPLPLGSTAFAPAMVSFPASLPGHAIPHSVPSEVGQSNVYYELRKSGKAKDNEIKELEEKIHSLLLDNEKLKQNFDFSTAQLKNHERTLKLIKGFFGIDNILSTSGDLLVVEIENLHNQFRRDEHSRINANGVARNMQLRDNEAQKLNRMYEIECEKARLAVKDELEDTKREVRELKNKQSEELRNEKEKVGALNQRLIEMGKEKIKLNDELWKAKERIGALDGQLNRMRNQKSELADQLSKTIEKLEEFNEVEKEKNRLKNELQKTREQIEKLKNAASLQQQAMKEAAKPTVVFQAPDATTAPVISQPVTQPPAIPASSITTTPTIPPLTPTLNSTIQPSTFETPTIDSISATTSSISSPILHPTLPVPKFEITAPEVPKINEHDLRRMLGSLTIIPAVEEELGII